MGFTADRVGVGCDMGFTADRVGVGCDVGLQLTGWGGVFRGFYS